MPSLIAAEAVEGALGGAAAKKVASKGISSWKSQDGAAKTGVRNGPGTVSRPLPSDYRNSSVPGRSAAAAGGKVKYRVGYLRLGSVLAISFIFDGLQFLISLLDEIPGIIIIPTFLGVVGSFIIAIIYSIPPGVSYTSGKKALERLMAIMGMATLEVVPILDDLPTLTADALFTAMSSWNEDRELAQENAVKAKGQQEATMRQQILLQNRNMQIQAEQAAYDELEEADEER